MKHLIVSFGLFLLMAVSAFAETTVYPDIANQRGAKAHCFEAGVCYIGGRLSNGQRCWIVETDAQGKVIARAWGNTWQGTEMLERHIAEKCSEPKTAPQPAPTPIPDPIPYPEPTPKPCRNKGCSRD